jgi:hypothetical protein
MKIEYTVIQDSREQSPFFFPKSDCCKGTIIKSLKSGDYSLENYEDIFVIERKGSITEWSANIFQDRFKRELERLESFKYPFIILEFTMDDIMKFPESSTIPKYKWKYLKVNANNILKATLDFQLKFKTKIIFAGCYGARVASSLFKRVIESESCQN